MGTTSAAVAETIADVTPAWLTAVLAEHGAVVIDRTADPIGTGQIGASYRVRPTYREQGSAPDTLVVKLAAGEPAIRQRVSGGFVKEVGFYTAIADTVAVRTPRCWHAALSDDQMSFSLLLDDLSPSVPGVQRNGCTLAQAADALRNVAALHAPRWNDQTLQSIDFLTPADAATAEFLGAIYIDAVAGFVERYRDELGEEDASTLVEVGPILGRWQLARPAPFSVIHGDYRLDNLMFPPERDGVAVLDWQTVNVGPPARDVAYFLGNSLDVELRRAHERELIAVYVDALASYGGPAYDAESCFADYRLGQLQGPMITVLGCMFASAERTPASDEMFLTMARRSCAAIRDLDSIAAVTDA